MRRRVVLLFLSLVALAVVAMPASAKSCVKGKCRAPTGVYESKVLAVHINDVSKNRIELDQVYLAKTFIKGACLDSGAGRFSSGVQPSILRTQWKFSGKAPVIGRVTKYRRTVKVGDDSFDITLKVHMLTAKKAKVTISYHELIQKADGGTSRCAEAGKTTVKFRAPGT